MAEDPDKARRLIRQRAAAEAAVQRAADYPQHTPLIFRLIPSRYREPLLATAGGGFAVLILLVYLALYLGAMVLGSITLDAWFGLPDWLSPFLMVWIALLFPELALVLAIAGFWYLP